MDRQNYLERVYTGLIGKTIGVQLGGPVEGWTRERILETYGPSDGYIVEYQDFASDDDLNGPMFFYRTLEDEGLAAPNEAYGRNWLNYVADGHGFFWWGGYGFSTENTAYQNLKNGIPSPVSGSIELNGPAVAEQIGGQIFADTWGLICPGRPDLAVHYARKGASVSHDGDGVNGALFVTAAIALAFVEQDMVTIVKKALDYVPKTSHFHEVMQNVVAFWEKDPSSYARCFEWVKANYGYDKYPGACHIIPNSAVIILSLLYGGGNFSRSIEICNDCGWDTDCNVGNVGTILGVFTGFAGINEKNWRSPIHDTIRCSSALGFENIVDLPTAAKRIAELGYRICRADFTGEAKTHYKPKLTFEADFALTGSTHGTRVKRLGEAHRSSFDFMKEKVTLSSEGEGLAISPKTSAAPPLALQIYYKTSYKPSDLHDSRYDPTFSPQVYPGQTITMTVHTGTKAKAKLYVLDRHTKELLCGETMDLEAKAVQSLRWTIPESSAHIEEMGLIFEPLEEMTPDDALVIKRVTVEGPIDTSLNFALEEVEAWPNPFPIRLTQMTPYSGLWDLIDGRLYGSCADSGLNTYGHTRMRDGKITWRLSPQFGPMCGVSFRVQGGLRSYQLYFVEGGIELYKQNGAMMKLGAMAFAWEYGETYDVTVEMNGGSLVISIDDEPVLSCIDADPLTEGCLGFVVREGSRCAYDRVDIKMTTSSLKA